MGYSFTLVDESMMEKWYDLDPDGREAWPKRQAPVCNSIALGIGPLPVHLNEAKFGRFSLNEAQLLADSIEFHLLTSGRVRRHSRADQLWTLVDWLRYWAEEGYEVHSG